MLAEIGFFSTFLALLVSFYGVASALWGARMRSENIVLSARNATYLMAGLLTVGTLALWIALITEQYQLSYVWSVTSPSMPMFFRVTSLWGSQAGSLMFWNWLMAIFAAVAVYANWHSHRRLIPYVIVFQLAVMIFFLGISLFIENPFERFWIVGQEVIKSVFAPAGAVVPSATNLSSSANGLNPLLRHFGMAIHPPMLYLGFVGFLVPCAFAFAALASGELSTNWIKASRRWTLIAWLFLSLGLILGGRWAYDVLGWGGYWGWDPVENAAFLPWLVGTAYLHSVMIQEKRGMFKTWNMVLMVATFSAVIFGTFATRSGLVESVHSFARSGIGFPMFVFWFSITLVLSVLIVWRRGRGELRDDSSLGGLFSREALFLLNNFVFIALFLAIFWGSFGAPITSEIFFNTNITLGKEYFLQVTPPLFLFLYILMGVAPLSAWGISTLSRMGRAMLIPLLLTMITLLLFELAGVTYPGALIGYGIVSLAGWVALYETYRAIMARVRTQKENPFTAFLALMQRNPRRYGGYMIHFGVTVIGIGVIGSTVLQQETQRTIGVGQSISIGGYELIYDHFEGGQVAEDGRIMDIATAVVKRNGETLATLRPRRDFFPQQEGMNSMTIAAAHSTLENDFYVLLIDWDEISYDQATFKVYINPLINLVWWGGLIFILGTLIAVFPKDFAPVRETRANFSSNLAKGNV